LTAASLIALDWGTTSARAYRMSAGGAVSDVRSAPLGIAQLQAGRYAEALDQLLGDWRDEPAPRIACGMIGSRQGWVEAPYVACPAPLASLAAGLAPTANGELWVVPGASTRDAHGVPDVMRGEETQIVGAVGDSEARTLVALPGTHGKWACVEAGRIVDFRTYLTGELWKLLLSHSILGRLAAVPAENTAPGPGFARGVARGLGPGDLAHDVFGARTLALMGELAADDVSDWLSGLMIGREVRDARAFARTHGYDELRVRLVGEDALVARYAAALAQSGAAVLPSPPHAAAAGLWRIASQAGIVGAR
jgi:2-dehydro-3-deoxygalactonokinase